VLLSWAGCCLLTGPAPAATTPADAGEVANRLAKGFDRAALQQDLARPMAALREQPAAVLRAYVQRLADHQFALELAVDVSPTERRILSEQILARIGQVGLLIRTRGGGGPVPEKEIGPPPSAAAPPDDMFTIAVQNAGLLVRVLLGLLLTFALGYLAARRRALRSVVVAGQRNPGYRSPAHGAATDPTGEGQSVALMEIRWALAAGRAVLLQMGYEVAPSQRIRFLELVREMREALRGVQGQTYTVWEDPAHSNRFYELLICRQVGVLDHLTAGDGPLARLTEQIEACRAPDGFFLRRVWLDAEQSSVADSIESGGPLRSLSRLGRDVR
jgi:hypothetical protein